MNELIRKIDAIPLRNYEGYIWYSDEKRPHYIGKEHKEFEKKDLSKYPFIVEGALYSKEDNISILIRCLDGEYYIYEMNLALIEANKEQYKEISHNWLVAKDANRTAKMCEIWTLEKDELCLNMPSFKPAFWAFKGFEKIYPPIK